MVFEKLYQRATSLEPVKEYRDNLNSVLRKIEILRQLPTGWDFGVGLGTILKVNEKIKILLNDIDKRYSTELSYDVTPRTDCGITLIICKDDDFINLSIGPNITIDLVWEKGIGGDYVVIKEKEHVTLHYIMYTISKIINEKCNSSELFLSSNIVTFQKGFRATHLESIKVPSLSSIAYVQLQ